MKSIGCFLITLIIVLQCSCTKSVSVTENPPVKPPKSLDSMLLCHNATNSDSTSIRNNIIGTWKWEYIKCYWKPEKANYEDYKNLEIEVKGNNTIAVKENGQLTQTATWELVRLNDDYFKLNVNPIVPQIVGKVIICQERVLFYDSYTDGCDNYFKK